MIAVRDNTRNQRGFTLMEVLIVIAIIAVLTGVAIPVLSGGLEKAKQSTDLANMRAAYAAATTEWMASVDTPERYYYSDGVLTTVSVGIAGYGQSSEDASTFAENLPVPVSGIPNKDGNAQYITLLMDDQGVRRMYWGTSGYSGPVVNSPSDYLNISNEEKLQSDIELFDALQEQIRSMSYGELLDLMDKYKLKKYFWNRNPDPNTVCYWIATSAIDLDTGEIRTDKNQIFVPELFEDIGFNTQNDPESLYIFGSVPNEPKDHNDYKCYVYIDLGVTYDYARTHRDEPASNAITYENDDGKGKHALSHINRDGA